MTVVDVTVCFDSSVLNPFARANRLDVLDRLSQGRRRTVTRAVLDEIERGRGKYPQLSAVAVAPWLEVVPVDSLDALITFNSLVRSLGTDSRNIGEASVLAWAKHSDGMAIIDDNTAVQLARGQHIAVRRSLALVSTGLQRAWITLEDTRTLIDDLITEGGARLPCTGASFEAWAEQHGLLT